MTTANPSPAYITAPMWQLWLEIEPVIPGVRMAGIYADKRGYHNTVNANKAKWPDNYSIQLPLDLTQGPKDKARAIDLVMSDAQMRLRTGYLRRSALDPEDDRLRFMREFYGTLDGENVYGLSKTTEHGPWHSSSADKTHLWHIHGSFFTAFVNVWEIVASTVSVLSGETWTQWKARDTGVDKMFCKHGDQGLQVEALQRRIVAAGGSVGVAAGTSTPDFDGVYGDNTAKGLAALVGGDGRSFGPAQLVALDVKMVKRHAGSVTVPGPPGPPGPAGKDGAIPAELRISGIVQVAS